MYKFYLAILTFMYGISLFYLSVNIDAFPWYAHRPDGWYLLIEFTIPNTFIGLILSSLLILRKKILLGGLILVYTCLTFYTALTRSNSEPTLFVLNLVLVACLFVYTQIIYSRGKG
ncbi:hypothetical protein FUAX_55100 (plasmid) [Fulvitalea axinellae]|uniref:DoxX family protein n=1 Tax=Fulvitalea axinellae TaxID=1182444 RepID=A0AAU9CSK1_9BACT|nr:hypothetical protein FUAX_55100 [Fulvitalea axinellae]